MLHMVNKSPYERTSLQTCLRLAEKGSPILLLEDGVYAAMKGTEMAATMEAAAGEHKVYVLGPDLKARGISESRLIGGLTVVDYGGFVDLVVENGTPQSWL